jgi:TonB-dependent starch-binding outer membrane protein SusC
MNARIGGVVLVLTVLALLPRPGSGATPRELAFQTQARAAITGRIVDDRTNRPLEAVQVYVEEARMGVLTDRDGRYVLENLPAGELTLAVQLIGYSASREKLRLAAGAREVRDYRLTERALDLDAIVVTGTVGGTQRRAIGNVVESVDVAKVLAVAPVGNVDQLIAQRTAGLMVLPAAGQVGTGSPLRIRGVNSLSLANEPLVFIDGVRMDSNPRQGPGQRGGARVSRLTDLNPEDIQSIEVIKGPSAATLYGTEASNGVIQIITKRGASGRTRFDVGIRYGTNWMVNPEGRTADRWWRDASGALHSVNIYAYERDERGGPIFTNGALQGYSASLGGGSETMRYFASGSYDHDVGIVPWNWDKRASGRLNLDLVPTQKVSARFGLGYINRKTRLAQANFDSDPMSALIWPQPSTLNAPLQGWFSAPRSEWDKFESRADNDRVTANVELRHTPLPWLSHRVNAGLDLNLSESSSLWPRQPEGATHFWGQNGLGRRNVQRETSRFLTLDYAASAHYTPLASGDLGLTSSVGFQFYKRDNSSITADGRIFPALPITTVSGGSTTTGAESFSENSTVGVYIQQEAAWRNRVFVTGAIRGDDNSAFGADYDAAIYPKLSATWVLHEEPFWKIDWVSQLRLRSAWGAAGQQPGTFDASRLYAPEVGYLDQPALVPSAYGNPQLKPERSQELEYGFDASLFNNRIDITFTRYQRNILDAIVRKPIPPSTGFAGSQIINIAEVKGWGNELGINALVVPGERLSWDVGVQFATNGTRIEDLGGLPPIGAGLRFEHRPGYPIGGIFIKHILSAKIDGNGAVTEALCDAGTGASGTDIGGTAVPCADAPRVYWGTGTPTWQLGFNSTLTLFRDVRLFARVEGNGGHYNFNTEMRASHNNGITLPVIMRNDPLVQATRAIENDAMALYDASFAKLREVSASYTLPSRLIARFGASSGAVTLAARNLMMLWTGHYGFDTPRDGHVPQVREIGGEWTWDPEIRSSGQIAGDYQTVLPPTASVTMAVRFSF